MELKTLLESLKKEIPYKWKIQTTPKWWKSQMDQDKKWQCVAYIDARDCMDILDSTCEWQDDYFLIRDTVFCKVGIKVWDEWIWRSDAGSKPDENSGEDAVIKWEASDAFKRACVKWWIGRFLYEKDFVWISYTDYNANKYKLTEFCNGNKKTPTSIPTKTTETPTGEKKQYARTEADDILDSMEIEDDIEHLKVLFAKLYPLGKSDAQKGFYKKKYEDAKKRIEIDNSLMPPNSFTK